MPYLSHRLDTRAVILLPASILEAGDPLFSCRAMSKTDTSLVSDVGNTVWQCINPSMLHIQVFLSQVVDLKLHDRRVLDNSSPYPSFFYMPSYPVASRSERVDGLTPPVTLLSAARI